MSGVSIIRGAMKLSDFLVSAYLQDLTNDECLKRPAAGANHALWQLGHLIVADTHLVEACKPGSVPPLPEGFTERYAKENAALDDPSAFDSKETLLQIYAERRKLIDDVLAGVSEDELDQPAPEAFRSKFPTVGSVFTLMAMHPTLHAGQWVVVRRMLGKPVII
jgi:hypothetical protein